MDLYLMRNVIQHEFEDLITPMKNNLLSIFTTRIIINLRVVGRDTFAADQDTTSNLHTLDGDRAHADVSLTLMFHSESQDSESQGSYDHISS